MKLRIISISIILILISLAAGALWGPVYKGSALTANNIRAANNISETSDEAALAKTPDQLIRFHVLANSDSEQDQALKRAVRDAILKKASPRLAVSQSLAESRQILKQIRPEIEGIGRSVVKAWSEDYTVHTEYGYFSFPTKSYGSLVLPAGEYEALRVVIGEGKGSNWWCVLFPPLCFVDISHSTAVPVDGKPGIPIKNESTVKPAKQTAKSTVGSPKVRFYFWEKINHILSMV